MIEGKNSLNTVSLEGYLKETNLQMKVVNGREAITGSITISVAENEDYRIRFFNYKTTSTGEDSANYLALRELMSDQAMSIATILKADGRLTFSQAALQATQVWARGRFGVYDRKDENTAVHYVKEWLAAKRYHHLYQPVDKDPAIDRHVVIVLRHRYIA